MEVVRSRVSTARGDRVKSTYDRLTERSFERSRYLIARRDAKDADVLVLKLPDGQTALPVFGCEEEAGMFMWLETTGEGWRVAKISDGGLGTLLRDSCADVGRIVHPFAANSVGPGPATMHREDFLRTLSAERSRRGEGAGHELLAVISAREEKISGDEDPSKDVLADREPTIRRVGVLRTPLASGEEALPVFGFEEADWKFLDLGTSGCWRVRETTAAELASVLVGSCAGVGRVVLDPVPGPFGETATDLDSVGRRTFMQSYLRNGELLSTFGGPGRR
jgi:hypothetical protein